MMTHTLRPVTVLLVLALGGSGACSAASPADSVTVMATWAGTEPGTEGYAFRKVLEAFTAKTGIRNTYQDTRALSQVLLSNVQAGTPPDVAVLPLAGELVKYARDGQIHPIDEVIDDEAKAAFAEQWFLPQANHIYAVPVKANLKSIVWHGPRRLEKAPQTLDELTDYTWCMGMGDAPSSGWPGSDLMEGIFLSLFGTEKYRQWAGGNLAWTSTEVKTAWQTWGRIAVNSSYGGPRTVLLTDFGDAGNPMFTDPPGCDLESQASFIMGFYQRFPRENGGAPRPGKDFDFFPLPGPQGADGSRPWMASADFAAMFRNTEPARQLMHFLASDEAQRIWPSIAGGSAFVLNRNVDTSLYSDKVSRSIAQIFRSRDPLCLDAADLMPTVMRSAYYQAMLDYLNDPNQLDDWLAELETIRNEKVRGQDWVDLPCGP